MNYFSKHTGLAFFFRRISVRSISTVLGVCIAIASLSTSYNFCETARMEFRKTVEGFILNHIFIIRELPIHPGALKLEKDIRKSLKGLDSAAADEGAWQPLLPKEARDLKNAVPGIRYASPLVRGTWTYMTPGGKSFRFNLAGIFPEGENLLSMRIKGGGNFLNWLEEQESRKVCVIGKNVKKFLFPNCIIPGVHLKIYDHIFSVKGEIESAGRTAFLDPDNTIFIPHSTLLEVMGEKERTDFFILQPSSVDVHEAVAEKAFQFLMRGRASPSFVVWDQADYIRRKRQSLETLQWMINSVSFLILLVACLFCANMMLVSIHERMTEIGLRTAVGASPRSILFMFFKEGFLHILIGGILGLAAGYYTTMFLLKPLPRWIPDFENWSFRFYEKTLLESLLILIIFAVFSSLIPAWKAARLDPVKALRRE
ncbi:MAG: ABC transporter permease [Candidatus Aureabacteria bacterium]|nr:ABC transporter permease [Candidatus Auribacterota bacterium]